MKWYLLTCCLFVLFSTLHGYAKGNGVMMNKDSWFAAKKCTSVQINKYKSAANSKIIKSLKLTEPSVIMRIMNRIEQIPVDGDMMISFGDDAEKIELNFNCTDKTQTIEIYNGKFKTPSTGFNSDNNEIESQLYTDILSLLKNSKI